MHCEPQHHTGNYEDTVQTLFTLTNKKELQAQELMEAFYNIKLIADDISDHDSGN